MVKSDGAHVRIDELSIGDSILAATVDGSLTYDTVSLFSLADVESDSTFVVLTTDAGVTLRLTDGHHVPVGEACCSQLKQAKDVAVGEEVWVASSGASIARAAIIDKSVSFERGLHNPVLTNGGFPVVDSMVTSFNSIEVVRFDAIMAPLAISFCKATGTCSIVRRNVAATECVLKMLRGNGEECKTYHYIDGLVLGGPTRRPADKFDMGWEQLPLMATSVGSDFL